MPLEDFILIVFCWIDDQLRWILGGNRLRRRGFAPKLSDSEVITMEVVGEFLGYDTDVQIWQYFSQHWQLWFPGLGSRTTFVQQAANLWVMKQALQQALAKDLGAKDDRIHLVDGFPVPVCVLSRAPRCRVFAGIADYGYCAAKREHYYGFHGHLMVGFDGVITGLTLTAAAGDERQALWELTPDLSGLVIGDKGYLGAFLNSELAREGIDLQTPLRANMTDTREPRAVKRLMTTAVPGEI